MALTTVALAKTHLSISGSSEDTALTAWVSQVDRLIKSYVKQNLEEATYTEYYWGSGTRELVLRQRPVQSITSLYEDGDGYFGYGSDPFTSADLLTAGTDYALSRDSSATEASKTGIVYRLGSAWPRSSVIQGGNLTGSGEPGLGNIKVTYVGGWSTANLPADLTLAANQLVGVIRRAAAAGGTVQSESLDYYSVTYKSDAEAMTTLGDVKQILSRYREWIW